MENELYQIDRYYDQLDAGNLKFRENLLRSHQVTVARYLQVVDQKLIAARLLNRIDEVIISNQDK